MPCKTAEEPPTFWENYFLSGTDIWRVWLIRAQYWLGRESETYHYFGSSRTILREGPEGIPEAQSGLIMGDSGSEITLL